MQLIILLGHYMHLVHCMFALVDFMYIVSQCLRYLLHVEAPMFSSVGSQPCIIGPVHRGQEKLKRRHTIGPLSWGSSCHSRQGPPKSINWTAIFTTWCLITWVTICILSSEFIIGEAPIISQNFNISSCPNYVYQGKSAIYKSGLRVTCMTERPSGHWSALPQLEDQRRQVRYMVSRPRSDMANEIKLLSFNCQGLFLKEKRHKVFFWLKQKKANMILLQESHSQKDKETVWNHEWGNTIIYSHGESNKKGVAILFDKNFEHKIHHTDTDPEGRYIILDIEINAERVLVVNSYAPNEDKAVFFEKLVEKVSEYETDNVIWGGDHNLVLNVDLDKCGGNPTTHWECRKSLLDFMEAHDMIDIWRRQNQKSKTYTWHSNPRETKRAKRLGLKREIIQSRIDFFLIPHKFIQLTKSNKIQAGYHSDHALVILGLQINPTSRGRGFWKLNTSLLEDPCYVEQITENLCLVEGDNPNTSPDLIWEINKCTVRRETISFICRNRVNIDKSLVNLEKSKEALVNDIQNHPEPSDILDKIKIYDDQINQIISQKTKGAAVRSRTRYYEEGEKSSKFFHTFELKTNNQKGIKKLITPNGTEVTEPRDILEEEKRYYEDLYSDAIPSQKNSPSWGRFLNDQCDHAEDVREKLLDIEKPLSEREIFKTLSLFERNKAPGSDGLQIEFYRTFWPFIKKPLLECFNYIFQSGKLSITQRQGVISLLPKKDKDPLYIANWRPISLMNTDYKILTKCLAERIKSVLPDLISSEQSGFVPGRLLCENIMDIKALDEILMGEKRSGMAAMLDFEKAFDSLRWESIIAAMETHGFGPNFIHWVKCLQNEPVNCCLNNGYFSRFFRLHRGVRQGCPLSPYLFILTVEILANNIRQNPEILGVKFYGHTSKISMYADDTTILCEDKKSLEICLETIKEFGTIAGLKLNEKKTEFFYLGVKNDNIFDQKCSDRVRLLGIKICHSIEEEVKENLEPAVEKIRKILNMWRARNLSLLGKIYIVKSLGIAQILHILEVLPTPPKAQLKKLEQILYHFIWNDGVTRIRKKIMIGPYDLGGAQMPDVQSLCDTLHIKWIQRLLKGGTNPWRTYIVKTLVPVNINLLLCCNLAKKDVHELFVAEPCSLWKGIFSSWCDLNFTNRVETAEEIAGQIIWLNSHIKQNSHTILLTKWIQAGVNKIRDLLDDDRTHFLTWENFTHKYNVVCTFLQYYGVLQSIPMCWRSTIRQVSAIYTEPQNPEEILQDLVKRQHRDIYDDIIRKRCDIPEDRFKAWAKDLNIDISRLEATDWTETFQLSLRWTISVPLRSFEFRYRSRDILTNLKLFQMTLKASKYCDQCPEEVDDIIHFFWLCPSCKSLWKNLVIWLESEMDLNLPRRPSFYLLGVTVGDEGCMPDILGLIFLLTRKYINDGKTQNYPISFNGLRTIIRETEEMEFRIAYRNNRVCVHVEKWGHLATSLKKEAGFATNFV